MIGCRRLSLFIILFVICYFVLNHDWLRKGNADGVGFLDMQPQKKIERVASELLATKGLQLISTETIQQLWAGYGHICRIQALSISDNSRGPAKPTSMILKYINPPMVDSSISPDEGHIRKVLSYQVEQYFYTHLATSMPKDIAVASCLASIASGSQSDATAMLMSDLREEYPVAGEQRRELDKSQVYSALDWLASFHGFWWTRVKEIRDATLCNPPLEHFKEKNSTVLKDETVWLNGGYTYLATRRKEYNLLKSDRRSEWNKALCMPMPHIYGNPPIAEVVAKFLSPSPKKIAGAISKYETLIHGDVKSENLFATKKGDKVAFYDFQYVGLGLGVCDLAKLFTCSVPIDLLGGHSLRSMAAMNSYEEKLLRSYLDKLQRTSGKKYEWDVFVRHWQTALVDWLRFQASWGFWGNTEWLEARVRSILADDRWKAWLEEQIT